MKKHFLLASLLLFTFSLFAQTLTSSNLPIIIINTSGQTIIDDPKITADMGIIYNGAARNAVTDPFNHYNGKIGIEVRGQSSQQFPMKSYGIELRDAAGASQDKALFGLPKESDWVLYAPYNEKTLLHNFLAYAVSREMGYWAANCRYVELVLNGDYKGIYVLMEKIKRGAGRVNISKLAATDISGDAVTGGYIFSIDKDADGWYSAYRPGGAITQRIQFSYVYPKITAIVPQQAAYLKSYVDSFENSLTASSFQDTRTGWRRFADEASFIDYFIVNEASRNVDGYRLSSYFYKDRDSKGGKITAGPVWDYDLAFKNANYCSGSNVDGWAYRFNAVCPADYWQVPFWWDRLMSDTAFASDLLCRWKVVRQTTLSLAHLNALIDSVAALTAEARQRHFQRWPVLGQYVWPNPQPLATTYDGEIGTLKSWLAARLNWIDNNLPDRGICSVYPADVVASVLIKIFPNPSRGAFSIKAQSRTAQPAVVQVYNSLGQMVSERNYSLSRGFNSLAFSSTAWSSGIYFVRISTGSGDVVTTRVMKY